MKQLLKKTLLFFFALFYVLSGWSQNIVAFEYWFDEAYTSRQQYVPTASQSVDVKQAIEVSSVGDGFHIIHMRAKDSNGVNSVVYSQCFYKNKALSSELSITSYEYWLDNHFEERRTEQVNESQNFVILSQLDMLGIDPGFHLFYIRSKDNVGRWSVPRSISFYQNPPLPDGNKIDAYCYWFDKDFDNIELVLLDTPVNPCEQQLEIAIPENFALGEHLFNIRSRDLTGKWSVVAIDTFSIEQANAIDRHSINSSPMIYPNPFKNQLFILPNDLTGTITVDLIDINGKVMFSDKIEAFGNEIPLNIPDLPNGLYAIRLTGEDKRTINIKVIKK